MRPAEARCPAVGRRGVAAVEFVLIAPVFFVIALACADLIQLFRAQLRVETIAVQIGQIVSQCRTITTPGDRDNFWAHGRRIAGTIINVDGTGAMVISAVGRNNNANRLAWQMRTGNTQRVSRLGANVGGSATISDNFVVPASQTLLVTEVFATVQPFALSAGLIGTVLPANIYGTTLFLSRAPDPTTLLTAPTNSQTPDCTG
ncbi:pilus assembly protein [Roseomonas sp. HJA6]|uniref:Pilus assembly protein n=1 Tax=Roseomonas alba TaxID=2846776 RepID=A0ABS7AFF0_9PROT|nr:TadE/TadG family type IV pilus assembly protein [Neoroseomonas alba]MBW6401019.1 pilus assembly protein [Neoroseomonas alba]